MDLGAYIQIEAIEAIAKANGIEVPRLRGYRLMSEEQPLSREEIVEAALRYELELCERGCESIPRFHPDSGAAEWSSRTRRIKQRYCVQKTHVKERPDGSEYSWSETVAFRWDLLHGKRRKRVKFAIKKGRRAVVKQLQTFNKYVGRDDVLYIHSRIGGRNWLYYGGPDIAEKPWFLEKVDDYFDDTYCDIYARIDRKKCGDAKGEILDEVDCVRP